MKKGNQIEAIVFRKKDLEFEFLLLKRTKERGGFWQPITGEIEKDETPEEAAKRELKEEINVKNILGIIKDVHSYTLEGTGKREVVLGVEILSNEKISLEKNIYKEHEEKKWVKFNEAIKLLKWPGNIEGLKRLNKILTKK